MTTSKKGRPREGSLYWVKSGYRARITYNVDGESVRKAIDLGTKNEQAAKAKLARLLKLPMPTEQEAKRYETFQEAAERIVGDSTIASKSLRLGRLRNHVYERIGHKPVNEVTTADVKGVLEVIAANGLSHDVIAHVKVDVGAVLGRLFEDEVLDENVVARIQKLPRGRVEKRERAVLTDEELAVYLSWEHPDDRHKHGVRERQTMACLSRIFGGVRIGDIRAMRWEDLDTFDGEFKSGYAARKKTARPQLLEIHETLRPILRDWWERHGRPAEGPVFPVLRGVRAGQERGRNNAAAALRTDLMRAFGLEAPQRVTIVRKGGKPDRKITWRRARMMTPREIELFEGTRFNKPVDFHSFRRAYKQALAEAGIDLQQSMHLSGSSDMKAHQRYLNNTAKARRLPDAAAPRVIGTGLAVKSQNVLTDEHAEGYLHAFPKDDGRITQRQSATFTRLQGVAQQPTSADIANAETEEQIGDSRSFEASRQNSVPKIPGAEEQLLTAISAAAQDGDTELVVQLTRLLSDRQKRRAGDVVVDLDDARKGGAK